MEKAELAVLISGLPTPLTDDGVKELKLLCDAAGEVRHTVFRDQSSVYVFYESEQTADDAVIALSGSTVSGQTLTVRACEQSEMVRLAQSASTESDSNAGKEKRSDNKSSDRETVPDSVESMLHMFRALSPEDKAVLLAALPGVPVGGGGSVNTLGDPSTSNAHRPAPGISTAYQGMAGTSHTSLSFPSFPYDPTYNHTYQNVATASQAPLPQSHFNTVSGVSSMPQAPLPPVLYAYPPAHSSNVRLSMFSGDVSKGEVSFAQWRSEVLGFKRDPSVAPNVLIQAIRRSLKGRASTVILHLADDANVDAIIQKLERVFGNVLPAETLLEQFYTARQENKEDVSEWSCRLEDLILLLKSTDSITFTEDTAKGMLRTKFWSGLRNQLIKNALRYKMDAGASHGDLLVAARRIETECGSVPASEVKVTHLSAGGHLEQKVDALAEQLSDLRKQLSQQKQGQSHQTSNMDQAGSSYKRNTFKGKCFKCGKVGHKKAFCPEN